MNSGLQASQQVPLPTESSCWPKSFVFSNAICLSVDSFTHLFIQDLHQGQIPLAGAGEREASLSQSVQGSNKPTEDFGEWEEVEWRRGSAHRL